jgi:hypothetical protein
MVVVTPDGKLAYVTTLAVAEAEIFWRRRAAGRKVAGRSLETRASIAAQLPYDSRATALR